MILSGEPENNWNNPIFHAEPKTPKPWVEYNLQSVINVELLTIDDPVFKNHWKEYHLWPDEWECCYKKSTIKPSGVIAKSLNHPQNTAGGRSYLSSDGTTLRYTDQYRLLNYNHSISKPY